VKLNSAARIDIIKMIGNIIERATPTKHAMDIPIGALEEIIQKMRADHPRYAGDQGALCHFLSRSDEGGGAQTSKIFTPLSADDAGAMIL
jgi:hypothetical protein